MQRMTRIAFQSNSNTTSVHPHHQEYPRQQRSLRVWYDQPSGRFRVDEVHSPQLSTTLIRRVDKVRSPAVSGAPLMRDCFLLLPLSRGHHSQQLIGLLLQLSLRPPPSGLLNTHHAPRQEIGVSAKQGLGGDAAARMALKGVREGDAPHIRAAPSKMVFMRRLSSVIALDSPILQLKC